MSGFIMTGEKTGEVPHLLHQATAVRARHGFFGRAGGDFKSRPRSVDAQDV